MEERAHLEYDSMFPGLNKGAEQMIPLNLEINIRNPSFQ